MIYLLGFPIFSQGLLLVIDEVFFHRKRGLPLWEKISHPIDTLSVLTVTLFCIITSPSTLSFEIIFFALSFASCCLVTKDEWVHSKLCTPGENWIHAALFILHPLVFCSLYLIWKSKSSIGSIFSSSFLEQIALGQVLLEPFAGLLIFTLTIQIVYWNLIHGKTEDQ